MEGSTPLDLERVREILEREIRPYVEGHGGSIELIGVEGTVVQVRLRGACERCSAVAITLRIGVERLLRRLVDPAIRVEQVP